MAQSVAFVVPWIKEYHWFAMFNKIRRTASVNDVTMLERYILPAMPELIDEKNKDAYIGFVAAMTISSSLKVRTSKKNKTMHFAVPLAAHRLAARQDGKLCLACDLFDHTDTVFSAALRVEKTSPFLMKEAQRYLSFWNELGIRRREEGRFKGGDYLACLRALAGRLADVHEPPPAHDIETVLNPLCTSTGSLGCLDRMTWSSIARLAVFPVSPASGNEPRFRRLRMENLASQKDPLSLQSIVQREHAAVCWSQTPFALHEPATFSLQQIGSKGQPSCAAVWEHLEFLAELAQSVDEADLKKFVEDLQATYEFLRVNLQESKTAFSKPGATVWLNAEATTSEAITLDVLRTSWTSLENLLLDSPCDAPPLMTVQPFLGRFSSLLKDLGCTSLHYPSITMPSSDGPKTTFALVRELWEEDVLTDVTFEAEGSTVSAHKIILASRSLYCRRQFHGSWVLQSDSTNACKSIKLEDMTYATLKILIGFCYDEGHDWAVGMRVSEDDDLSVIADKLDWLIDVLVAADRWVMPGLHADAQRQVVQGIRYFVRPDNVEYVSKVAAEANAVELRNYCEEYRRWNAEAILLAS